MMDDGMESKVCLQTPPVPRYFLILSDLIEAPHPPSPLQLMGQAYSHTSTIDILRVNAIGSCWGNISDSFPRFFFERA